MVVVSLVMCAFVGVNVMVAGIHRVFPITVDTSTITKPHPDGIQPPATPASAAKSETPCATDKPVHSGLSASTNAQLRKLAEYEAVCGGALASRYMFFAPTPTNAAEAASMATDMAVVLKEFAKYGIAPLVILEPTTTTGNVLDVQKFATGYYDNALNTYFQALKQKGITDQMMGIWVPFPEGNTPVWNITDPNLFVANVVKVVGLQKQHFPGSKASILLNSQSYPSHDVDWDNGSYASLVPYVKDMPKGLLDSFGYQGFPWIPPANDRHTPALLKADEFLRADLASEAARTLGVKEVWLNTGTFAKAHVESAETVVTMNNETRKSILHGILQQAKALRAKDLTVAVHIFAEDKSINKEGVNWSYWQAGKASESSATPIFKDFVHDLLNEQFSLWLYDDDHR